MVFFFLRKLSLVKAVLSGALYTVNSGIVGKREYTGLSSVLAVVCEKAEQEIKAAVTIINKCFKSKNFYKAMKKHVCE